LEEEERELDLEEHSTSDHSSSTATANNVSTIIHKGKEPTSTHDSSPSSSPSTSDSSSDAEYNDSVLDTHCSSISRKTTMETTEDQNTTPDSSKHVQDIDVRANPEGALAHFEEQLKTFSEPSFSPEIETQVRVEATAGKECNRCQKEALLQEMEIDEPTQLVDGGQQNTVKNPTHTQTEPIHNTPSAPSVPGSSAPCALGLTTLPNIYTYCT
jgi:hypothetical protein